MSVPDFETEITLMILQVALFLKFSVDTTCAQRARFVKELTSLNWLAYQNSDTIFITHIQEYETDAEVVAHAEYDVLLAAEASHIATPEFTCILQDSPQLAASYAYN